MTFDEISDVIQQLSSTLVYVIAIGSLLDAASPPPLDPNDPDMTALGKWRKRKIYRWYYKAVGFCAANIGWAKNLASPKAMGIVGNIVKGITDKQALSQLAQEASDATKESQKHDIPVTPQTEVAKQIVSTITTQKKS